MELKLIPLHQFPQYLNECAEVLNEEWKRSHAARVHVLEKSRDSFPVNLILLEDTKTEEAVVLGHSRLSPIIGHAGSCLVESVVVRKSLRRKGYGRILMDKTERFAASKGFEVMYLTTHDKQKFYEHLGYEYCSPVLSVGSDIVPDHLAQKLMGNLSLQNNTSCVSRDTKTNSDAKTCNDKSLPENSVQLDKSGLLAVQKGVASNIATPPPPPPPPPCPAAPPPPAVKKPLSGEDISRFDPRNISWMKKQINS